MANIFSFFSKKNPLPQSLEQIAAFLQLLPSAAFLMDEKGTILFANDKTKALSGFKSSALQGTNIAKYGLTPEEVHKLVSPGETPFIIKDLVSKKLEPVSVHIAAARLPDSPYIIVTLEEAPRFRKLEAEKSFFKNITEQYPFAVSVQDDSGICLAWNARAEQLFGPSCASAPGRAIKDLLPEALLSGLEVMDREAYDKLKALPARQMSFKGASGKEIILRVWKTPLLQEEEVKGILSVYEDITDRSSQEEELLQTRNLLQAILNNVPLGIYTRKADGTMTFTNEQSHKIFAESEPKYANIPYPNQDPNVISSYEKREQQVLEEGVPHDYPDEVYVNGSGEEKLLHIIKVPLPKGGPEPLVMTIVEDVTKRRQQEKEIEEANRFLSAIVANAPIGLYARTKAGRMMLRNKQCAEIFETEETSFDEYGKLPHETQEQSGGYLDREAQILQSGQTLHIAEEEYTLASGETKTLHMIKVPVKDADEKSEFVITLVEDITEKKKQEKSLAEANNFRQAILDNAPLAIYAYDVHHNVVFFNKKVEELFPGVCKEKEDENKYNAREKEIFAKKEIMDIPQEEYVRADGSKVLLHLIKAPVFDVKGQPFMVLTIAEDITQKKQQEKEISNAKNFLQNVVDNLPLALSVKTYEGRYILWNKKSEDLFGVKANEVIGKDNYRADITKEQAEFLLESDKKVFEQRKALNIAQELISTPDEGVKIMHTVKMPLFTPEGDPDCLLTVSEDITVKTKMEKQIREAGEKNSLLVENAREGILILEDSKIIYANRAACVLLGYEVQEEIIRKTLTDFVAPDYLLFAKEKYEAAVSGLESALTPEQLQLTRSNGSLADVELSALASKYLGRRIVIVFLRDVTAQNKSLREARLEREQFKNAFERGALPALILNHKGYISVMNKAARELFNLTEHDRHFYRNVYIRPALTLQVRRQMRRGESARMEYVFDFAKAAAKFPGRINGEGQIKLHVLLEPFNRRNTKDGSVEADYLVTLDRRRTAEEQPAEVAPAEAEVWLPNSEPYAVCADDFKIISCNEQFSVLCQLSKEELQNREIIRLFSHDCLPQLLEDLKRLQTKGKLENRDYRIHVASGLETVPVRVSATRSTRGEYVFVFRNLLFQNQLRQLLRERSAQFNALLEVTEGAVFSVYFKDGEFGRVESADKRLARLSGYRIDELLALPFERLFMCANKNQKEIASRLRRAARELENQGRAAFKTFLYTKEGHCVETSVTLSSLDIPGKNTVLVLLNDLSGLLARLSDGSKEALELRSVRQSLPGLYLKTDWEGNVLEATSNLPYLDDVQLQELFLNKKPEAFWPAETAAKAHFAIKEAAAVNVNTTFEFDWELVGKQRYFEAVCTPIGGREETVLWIKDVTERRRHEQNIRELYALSNENKSDLTPQVDRILEYGKKMFQADIGLVLRFSKANPAEQTVLYATPGPFNIERYMVFPVEECLFDVRDDNVVLWPNLKNAHCKRCIHKEKQFNSLIAAPLYVGGKVAGALCFASKSTRVRFEEGAEELIGIMSRILSLRIELREASKTLSETSQSFMRTLEYVDLPAVMLDLNYNVRYVNDVFLSAAGCTRKEAEDKEFFDAFIRSASSSRRVFESAASSATGNAFQVKLDLASEHGRAMAAGWDVFVMKDIKGEVEGYGLIGVRNK